MIEAVIAEEGGSNGLTGLEALTKREHEIAEHLSNAETSKTIADKLEVVEQSIKNYLSSIYRKLNISEDNGINNRVKAASMYMAVYGSELELGNIKIDSITPKEEEILELLAEGYTNKKIGEELGHMEKTITNYIAKIYSKFHVPEDINERIWTIVIYKKFVREDYNPPNNPLNSRDQNIADSVRSMSITTRQHEIMDHLCYGESNREIAEALGITEKTVKNQISDIYSRLGVSGMKHKREAARLEYQRLVESRSLIVN